MGDGAGGPQPQRIVLVHQQDDLLLGAGGGFHRLGEFCRVIAVAGGKGGAVEGRLGRGGQLRRTGKAPVVIRAEGVPVDAVGEGGADGGIGEHRAFHIAGQVQENAVFAVPQLVVAPVVCVFVAAGVGAHQAQSVKFEIVPDAGDGAGLFQADGRGGDHHVGVAPPVGVAPQQGGLGAGIQVVRTGAQGVVFQKLGGLDDGDVQQQRQVFHGDFGFYFYAAVLGEGDLGDLGEAPAVVKTVLGGQQCGANILGGEPAAVGKGGVGDVEGVGLHVLGHAVVFAQLGLYLIFPVHGKQALVQQGEQRPVGKVRAKQGIHGDVRVVGEGQGLVGDLVVTAAVFRLVPGKAAAGGHIGFLAGSLAAAEQTQEQSTQQYG